MTFRTKILGSALAIGAVTLAAGSAGAVTVVNAVAGGPFSLSGNTLGTILNTTLMTGNIYDFTFTIEGPANADVLAQLQASVTKNKQAVSEPIDFTLFANTGTIAAPSAGTNFGTISLASVGPSMTVALTPGNYFVQVNSIAVNNETASGAITLSAVPEPATWGVMLFGFGAIGASMRSRRKQAVTA